MKVNLHVNPKDKITGYINICGTDIIDELNAFVEDAEAREIIVNEVVEYTCLTEVDKLITVLIKKLRIGGSIVFVGTDIYTLLKDYMNNIISIDDLNIGLYDTDKDKPKRCMLDANGLVHFLSSAPGMQIMKKELNQYTYCVGAKRNE